MIIAPRIPQLAPTHQGLMTQLVNQIQTYGIRNRLRRLYYDYKQPLRDLGIALPPSMKSVEAVLGWPAKAVDSMARRTVLDTWTTPDGLDDEIDAVVMDNRMASEVPAGLTSSLMHGVSFGFVTAGDVEAGEPESILTIRSAEWSTGIWDSRRRCLSAALSVLAVDAMGAPSHLVLYVPNLAIVMRRDGNRWDLRQSVHDLGVPAEPIPYRPLLDRPFGASRITRPVMALTDSAVRTQLRTEVGAEFYNAPQRYALGGKEDAFKAEDGSTTPGWMVRLGALLTLEKDEDGDVPTVGQFSQQSMQPNVEQMRMISQLFAAETSLPLRSLGVMGDNPESAESQQMAERDMDLENRHWRNGSLTPAFKRLMTLALRIRDDSPAANDAYRRIAPHWEQSLVSLQAGTDAVVKLNSVSEGFGDSDVGLEMAGLEPDQISRYRAEQRRKQGTRALSSILDRAGVSTSGDTGATALAAG